jgi:hypothetical protein
VTLEMRRRATLIVIALVAWRLEHGTLPQTLDQLDGVDLDEVPLDPWNNKPFNYQPAGLPYEIKFPDPPSIAAGQPFLWSVGSLDARIIEVNGEHRTQSSFQKTDLAVRPRSSRGTGWALLVP